MSRSATSSRQSRYQRGTPNARANSSASSKRARLTATSSLDSASRSAAATRLRTMSPAPMSPQAMTFGTRTVCHNLRPVGSRQHRGYHPCADMYETLESFQADVSACADYYQATLAPHTLATAYEIYRRAK